MRRNIPPIKPAGGSGRGGGAVAKSAKKPYSRADPIGTGEILTDLTGKRWRIGKSIGVGGFGEIYIASDDVNKPVNEKTAAYVVKIEPFTNGPLFVEIAVYLRMARSEMIDEWKKSHKMDSLGMPNYVTSGSHEYKSQRYRFLVIPRYGIDLYKIVEAKPVKRLSCRCVQAIALQIVDIIEYIHSRDYIHGDIKASNICLSLDKKHQQLYLLDFGLGSKFVDASGVHEVYAPDARKAHNGTLEYTSRDAHIGAFSRRGDLEILGYNMLEWLCGKLPWSNSDTPANVSKQKIAFMNSVQLNRIYPTDIVGLDICEKYLRYVATLSFDQQPNYNQCREILKRGLPSKVTSLYIEDNIGISPKKKRSSQPIHSQDQVDGDDEIVTKKIKVPEEDGAGVKRATRTTKKVKNFNWTRVLSSNPEEIIRSASQTNSSTPTTPTEKLSPELAKPTPAMLQILSKKKENVQSNMAVRTPSASDLLEPQGPHGYTDAMREIMMRCKKKKLRKSSSETELSLPFKIKKPVFRTPLPTTASSPKPKADTAAADSSSPQTMSSRQARHLRRNQ